MHCDTLRGEPLHVGHRRIVIGERPMHNLFLEDGEQAGRRLASLAAARYCGGGNGYATAVQQDALSGQIDHHEQGSGRSGLRLPDKLPGAEPSCSLYDRQLLVCHWVCGSRGGDASQKSQFNQPFHHLPRSGDSLPNRPPASGCALARQERRPHRESHGWRLRGGPQVGSYLAVTRGPLPYVRNGSKSEARLVAALGRKLPSEGATLRNCHPTNSGRAAVLGMELKKRRLAGAFSDWWSRGGSNP